MRLETLESRDCADAAFIGSGVVALSRRFQFQPFADWRGDLSVYDTGVETWIGAGVGGGPRVAVVDDATGQRTRPDWFAGDPADRSGVVFVNPTPAQPAPRQRIPEITAGVAGGFPLFIDFEGDTATEPLERDTLAGLGSLFAGIDVSLTNVRPDLPPGGYGTAVVGAPMAWYTRAFGIDGVAGYAPAADFGETRDSATAKAVYVGPGYSPPLLPALIAHEIGHGFGLVHTADPLDIMYPSVDARATFSDEQKQTINARESQ